MAETKKNGDDSKKGAPKSDKRLFQLKHQDTGFHDPETGVKILRDQTVEIDMGKRVGRVTTAAIRAGRLIEVKTKPASQSQKSEGEQEAESEPEAGESAEG